MSASGFQRRRAAGPGDQEIARWAEFGPATPHEGERAMPEVV